MVTYRIRGVRTTVTPRGKRLQALRVSEDGTSGHIAVPIPTEGLTLGALCEALYFRHGPEGDALCAHVRAAEGTGDPKAPDPARGPAAPGEGLTRAC